MKIQNDTYTINLYNRYGGGLIVISLNILQDFISSGVHDLASQISTYAFAIATPLLSGMLILNTVESRYQYITPRLIISRIVHIVLILSIIISLIGIAAAFWHISWEIGTIFITTLVIALIIYSAYIIQLKEHP